MRHADRKQHRQERRQNIDTCREIDREALRVASRRQIQRHTEKHTEKHRGTQPDKREESSNTHTLAGRQNGAQRRSHIRTHRQAGTQTNRQIGTQADRNIVRHARRANKQSTYRQEPRKHTQLCRQTGVRAGHTERGTQTSKHNDS